MTPLATHALRSLSLAIASLLAACSPPDAVAAEAADDDLSEPAGPIYALYACSPSPCDGLSVARPNRPSTRCADGQARPLCPAASLSFAPSGLAEPEQRAVAAALIPPGSTPRALVRGALRASASGPVLDVVEARLSPSPSPSPSLGPAEGSVAWLFPDAARCSQVACSALRHREANLSASRLVSTITLAETAGEARARNLALVEAFSPDGLLALGTTSGRPTDRAFSAGAIYLRLSSEPGACQGALEQRLSQAAAGLLWPSESDFPVSFTRLSPSGEGPPTVDEVRSALSLPGETPIEVRPLDRVFGWAARFEPGMAPDETALSARFRALRAAIERDLVEVTAFAAGTTEVHLFIVGRSRCGELAGVMTTLIET